MRTARHAVAVAALGVLMGSTLAGCDTGDAGPLSGETWVLTSALDGGNPVNVDDGNVRLRFVDGGCGGAPECPSGPKLIGHDGCNEFTRSIRFDGTEVAWGDYWHSTAKACDGGIHSTVTKFFRNESLRFVVDEGALQLTSADGEVDLSLRPD